MKLIIFDGVCGLCNRSVDMLIKIDTQKQFRYTSLQGTFVQTLGIAPQMDSIIFYDNGSLYYKSTAILKIFRTLGGWWVLTQVCYILPRVFRDYLYDCIAKHRYALFGKLDTCRMPKEEEKALFID